MCYNFEICSLAVFVAAADAGYDSEPLMRQLMIYRYHLAILPTTGALKAHIRKY